jgi:hypothetical protein
LIQQQWTALLLWREALCQRGDLPQHFRFLLKDRQRVSLAAMLHDIGECTHSGLHSGEPAALDAKEVQQAPAYGWPEAQLFDAILVAGVPRAAAIAIRHSNSTVRFDSTCRWKARSGSFRDFDSAPGIRPLSQVLSLPHAYGSVPQ